MKNATTREGGYRLHTVDGRKFVERPNHIPLDLEPIDVDTIEAKLNSFSQDPAGFDELCRALLTGDPPAIHCLLYLAAGNVDTIERFGVRTDLLSKTVEGDGIEFRPLAALIRQFIQEHPEQLILLATEFYKQGIHSSQAEVVRQQAPVGINTAIKEGCYTFATAPEIVSRRTLVAPISADQYYHFVDTFIDYLASDNGQQTYQSIRPEAQLINRFDSDYAARRATQALRYPDRLSGTALKHLTELLIVLAEPPAEIKGKVCDYHGQKIRLDQLDSAADQVERLSIYGQVAVLNDADEIIGYFSLYDLTETNKGKASATIKPLEPKDLFFQSDAEGGLSTAEQADLAITFKKEHQRYAKHFLFKSCRVPLATFPLKEQVGLVRLLRSGNEDLIDMVEQSSKRGGKNVLRTYAIAYAYHGNLDAVVANGLLKAPLLIHEATPPYATPMDYFIEFVQRAEAVAATLRLDLVASYPGLDLNAEDIARALNAHALDALSRVSNPAEIAAYKAALRETSAEIVLATTYFREIIRLADQQTIDFGQCIRRHEALQALSKNNPIVHGMFVDLLIKCKKLRPDKELIWRVDRPMSEYNRRTGMDNKGLAAALAQGYSKKQNYFETGPGNGNSMDERRRELGDWYTNFSMSDVVCYPLRPLLTKCIDFTALASATNESLSVEDQTVFADYLYKVLYLRAGAGGDGPIDLNQYYDRETIEAIADNPNVLQTLLPNLGEKLKAAPAVPSEFDPIKQPDGTLMYDKKIELSKQSKAFQAALAAFAEEPNRFLNQAVIGRDLKEQIPIFPVGMILGDFSQLGQIEPDQVLAGVDVKALEKLPDAAYIKALVDIGHLLKPERAAFTSDSVRRDYGNSFRLAALIKAQRELGPGYKFFVTKGPGEPGEDSNAQATIRGVVITRVDVSLDFLQQHVASANNTVHLLDDVVSNKAYIDTLDKEDSRGGTWQSIQAALAV